VAVFLVDVGLWCIGVLPDPVARGAGAALAFVAYRILRYRLHDVRRQMAASFPEKGGRELRSLEKGFYRHLGATVVETLRLAHYSDEQVVARTRLSGEGNFYAAEAHGKGVFVLAGHLGNWEFGLAGFGARGHETHAVVKEIKTKVGQHLADRIRASHGIRCLARRNSIREIFRKIKDNQPVGFVLDQNMTVDEGVFVDFFGRPACTMPGLAVMVRRTGAAVVPMSCYRDEHGIHHVHMCPEVPWEELEGASPEEVVRHNTQRYTKTLEDIIRQHPEQWLWVHRRWKTKPPQTATEQT
jgi:KDO2-lipid IV(A) lauroyltransferase